MQEGKMAVPAWPSCLYIYCERRRPAGRMGAGADFLLLLRREPSFSEIQDCRPPLVGGGDRGRATLPGCDCDGWIDDSNSACCIVAREPGQEQAGQEKNPKKPPAPGRRACSAKLAVPAA